MLLSVFGYETLSLVFNILLPHGSPRRTPRTVKVAWLGVGFKDDFQSVLINLESSFAWFDLIHVRYHNVNIFATIMDVKRSKLYASFLVTPPVETTSRL